MSASRSSSPSIDAGVGPAAERAPLESVPPPDNVGARAIGRRPRMSRFLRVLVTITSVVHVPFVVGVAELLQRGGVGVLLAWAVATALGVAGVAAFLYVARGVMNDTHRPAWRTVFVDTTYYVHWCACVFCLVPSLCYLLFEPLVDLARGMPVGPRGGFFMWTYACGLVVCGYGVTFRRWRFQTKQVEIRVKGLDAKLDGYTIAQLSDLHIGGLTPKWWGQRWIDAANGLSPDLVVVTGDMVTSGVEFHEDIAELVGGLKAKDGTFVIMGNHDYFGEGEPLVTLLQSRGVNVLRNEGTVLERNGGRMFLAGIDDTWTKRADLDRALTERPAGMPTVLLAHDPDRFKQAVERKVDVVLSGHTHGGQIAVPFFARSLNASKLAHHYHLGAYHEGDSTLYVHPGLGTTGPPIRLGVPPAVVLLKLRAA